MKQIIPDGLVGKDLYSYLVANKKLLINQKKSAIKEADAISASRFYIGAGDALAQVTKADNGGVLKASFMDDSESLIERTSVINTTYWYDSHGDVHIDGLWKKSIAETNDNYLVEEHKMNFRGIISEEVRVMTKKMSWRDLGLDIDGTTEALIYVSKIDNMRNPYMFEQYKYNRVKNHSVGMRYVNLQLAVNDEDWKEEFAVWNKHIGKIGNRVEVEADGYFFAVTEAKNIEGSAVVKGSNIITPTLPNTAKNSTEEEPGKTTPEPQPQPFDISKAIQQTTFLKF